MSGPDVKSIQKDAVRKTLIIHFHVSVTIMLLMWHREAAHMPGGTVRHGLPHWFSGKESTHSTRAAEDTGSIPGLGKSHGGGHGNPLQCSCLEDPMDRGAWWATVHRVVWSWTCVN